MVGGWYRVGFRVGLTKVGYNFKLPMWYHELLAGKLEVEHCCKRELLFKQKLMDRESASEPAVLKHHQLSTLRFRLGEETSSACASAAAGNQLIREAPTVGVRSLVDG